MSVSSSGKVPLGTVHPLPGVVPGTGRCLVTGSELEWTGAPATLCTCPSPVLAECPPAGRTQQVVPFIQPGAFAGQLILQKRAQTYWAQSQADSATAQNILGVHCGLGSAPEDRRAAGASRCTAGTHPGGLATQGCRGQALQVWRTVQIRHRI